MTPTKSGVTTKIISVEGQEQHLSKLRLRSMLQVLPFGV